MLRTVGYAVGLLLILLGLIWIAQGSGYFPYPASSFMINQSIWILWGSIMAAAGIAVTVIISRLRRRG
jgi:high-affinity Fe2+/Pb2+ permease